MLQGSNPRRRRCDTTQRHLLPNRAKEKEWGHLLVTVCTETQQKRLVVLWRWSESKTSIPSANLGCYGYQVTQKSFLSISGVNDGDTTWIPLMSGVCIAYYTHKCNTQCFTKNIYDLKESSLQRINVASPCFVLTPVTVSSSSGFIQYHDS